LDNASSETPNRARAVCRFADLRPTDDVLDVGSGDGLVATEMARLVEHVHGIDISPTRTEQAARLAAERGIRNATFETVAISDFGFEPLSWDVTVFMRVWGKSAGTKRAVGAEDLVRILRATRRQVVMQAGKRHLEEAHAEILDACDQNGFDVFFFRRPTLTLANRRGEDVRLGELPELAIVPTAWLLDQPTAPTFR
jgi:SAM-dependent methyltransferase